MHIESNKEAEETGEISRLLDLFHLCLAKWYWFVLSVCITVFLALLYIRISPVVYKRTASLLIKEESKGGQVADGGLLGMGMLLPQTNIYNEMYWLESPALVTEVVKRLNLEVEYTTEKFLRKKVCHGKEVPCSVHWMDASADEVGSFLMEYLPQDSVRLSRFVTQAGEEDLQFAVVGNRNDTLLTPVGKIALRTHPEVSPEDPEPVVVTKRNLYAVVSGYVSRLSVSLNQDKASVLNLTIEDASAARAEDFLTQLIEVYNENWIREKNQIAVSTSQFIGERLQVIERELAGVDHDISSFKSEQLLPDVKVASNLYMNRSEETDAQMLALNNQLQMTRYIHTYLREEAAQNQLLPVHAGMENATLEKQIAEYNSTLLQRNSLIANSSDRNPLIRDMDQALEALRHAIGVGVENQMETLQTKMENLRQREVQTLAKIAANPTQANYLLSVERQQKVKEALYLFLLQKREENALSQAFTAYNTQVIAMPYGSENPTAPRKPFILLFAVLTGMLLPALGVLFIENIDTTIQGKEDLAGTRIPLAGEIPLKIEKKGFPGKRTEPDFMVVQEENQDPVNEAFRILRTNLDFLIPNAGKGVVVMSTSFNPGSGKTFVTLNLSLCMAIKGKRIVIVDLDLRKATLSRYLNGPKNGVSNYLAGQVGDWKEMCLKGCLHDRIDTIPAGVIPPNPSELLLEKRLQDLVTELKREYDYVFLDCPPVEIVADTQIIGPLADHTLFVVRKGLMDRRLVPDMEAFQHRFKGMLLLLNGVDPRKRRYAGYRYGYS